MVSGNAGRKNDSQKKNSNSAFHGNIGARDEPGEKSADKERDRLPGDRKVNVLVIALTMPGRGERLDPSFHAPDDRLAGASGLKTVEDHQKQRRQHEKADDDKQDRSSATMAGDSLRQEKNDPRSKVPTWLMACDFSLMTRSRPLTLLYEAVYAASIVVGGSIVIHIRCDAFFAELGFIGARVSPDLHPRTRSACRPASLRCKLPRVSPRHESPKETSGCHSAAPVAEPVRRRC